MSGDLSVGGIYSLKDSTEVFKPIPHRTSKPDITILSIFIGRDKVLKRWLKGLEEINYPKNKIHILWVCPKKDDVFRARLKSEFMKLSGYHSRTLVFAESLGIMSITRRRFPDYYKRNQLITDNYNFAKSYVGPCDYVFFLEDDVITPPDSFKKMMYQMKNKVTGAVVGRLIYRPEGIHRGKPLAWNIRHVYYDLLGHQNKKYDVTFMEKQEAGIEEAGSGTFGCLLVRSELFRMIHMQNKIGDIEGPDTTYGELIRDKGYKYLIDWSIHAKHMNETKNGVEVYV